MTRDVLAEVVAHVGRVQHRALQDALAEATAAYWERRAEAFDAVGTDSAAEKAQACRNAATVALIERWDADDCCRLSDDERTDLERIGRFVERMRSARPGEPLGWAPPAEGRVVA